MAVISSGVALVNDPVITTNEDWPDWTSIIKDYVGQRVIVTAKDNYWIQCGVIDEEFTIKEENELWLNSSNNCGRFGGDTVTNEEFLDIMKERYPEHLDWLLFHPELL